MQLTHDELRTAALADSYAYAVLRGRIAELRQQGREDEANALQDDYEERLGRWEELIKELACEGLKKQECQPIK